MVKGRAKGCVFTTFRVCVLVLVMLIAGGICNGMKAEAGWYIDEYVNENVYDYGHNVNEGIMYKEVNWDVEDSIWIEPFLEYFIWKEFNKRGEAVVKETGFKAGAGISGISNQNILGMDLLIFYEMYLFGGKTEYDGHTWGGDEIEGEGKYFGGKGEIELGIKELVFKGILPYAGMGWDIWERDLRKMEGDAIGYREIWGMFYCKAGMKMKIEEVKGSLVIDSWVGTDIVTRNRAKLSEVLPNSSDVTVNPDGAFFYGIEADYRMDKFFVKLYYNYYRWKKSDPETAIIAGRVVTVYQPESEEKVFGLSIGFYF